MADISYLKYSYEAVCVNEYTGLTFRCTDEQLAANGGYCPITTGEQILDTLAMQDATVERSVVFLAGFIMVLNIIFYVFIRWKSQFPAK